MGNLNVFNFLDVKNLLQLSFPNAAQVGLNSCVLFFQNGIKSEPSNESFWMIFPDAQSKAALVSFGFGTSSPQLLFQWPRTQFLLCQIATV